MQSYSLYEINEFIRQVLALNFPDSLWVRCEIAQVKNSRGHYFIDVLQKEEEGDGIIAQGQAVLWNKEYRMLHKKLGLELDALLQEGIEVLFLAKVNFNERYGLKLMVQDFDPAYTLGKFELKRRETIRQLQQLQLLEKNKSIPLPKVLQRIAVLSSETAAGYQDFLKHLGANSFGYRFDCQLFPTPVQGTYVEVEMMEQLSKIEKKKQEFDSVVIIRGGGAKLDLAAFDSFPLCKMLANYPLPILTGIGHDVDETVTDLVAHTSLKTPTAVADFIIHHNLQFETEILNFGQNIRAMAAQTLKDSELKVQHLWQMVNFQTRSNLRQQRMMLDYIAKEVPGLLKSRFQKEKMQMETLEKTARLLSPEVALKRGFSITLKNGKVVTDATSLKAGEEIETRLFRGSVHSTVKKTTDEQ